MITRKDLKLSKMRLAFHLDGSDYCANHYANVTWPKLTCIVTHPRRRKSRVVYSKRFYFDGREVSGCRELLDLMNAASAAGEIAA